MADWRRLWFGFGLGRWVEKGEGEWNCMYGWILGEEVRHSLKGILEEDY